MKDDGDILSYDKDMQHSSVYQRLRGKPESDEKQSLIHWVSDYMNECSSDLVRADRLSNWTVEQLRTFHFTMKVKDRHSWRTGEMRSQ